MAVTEGNLPLSGLLVTLRHGGDIKSCSKPASIGTGVAMYQYRLFSFRKD